MILRILFFIFVLVGCTTPSQKSARKTVSLGKVLKSGLMMKDVDHLFQLSSRLGDSSEGMVFRELMGEREVAMSRYLEVAATDWVFTKAKLERISTLRNEFVSEYGCSEEIDNLISESKLNGQLRFHEDFVKTSFRIYKVVTTLYGHGSEVWEKKMKASDEALENLKNSLFQKCSPLTKR